VDPASLPECGPGDVVTEGPTSSEEAIPPRPYGIGIVLNFRSGSETPCHLRAEVSIDIVEADGNVVPVGGDHSSVLDAYFPSYEPNHPTEVVWWRLGGWCPAAGSGPYSVRVVVDGMSDRIAAVPELDRACAQGPNEPSLDPIG
jgi:hypothetical protein